MKKHKKNFLPVGLLLLIIIVMPIKNKEEVIDNQHPTNYITVYAEQQVKENSSYCNDTNITTKQPAMDENTEIPDKERNSVLSAVEEIVISFIYFFQDSIRMIIYNMMQIWLYRQFEESCPELFKG